MTYLGSPGQITVDGVVLNIEDGDTTWVFDKIEGWHEGPGIDVETEQRTTSHGEFAQDGHRTGRTITISGWVMGSFRATVAAAVRRLSSVLADGGFGTFELADDDEGTLTATVQLFATPKVVWDKQTYAEFQLQFHAPSSYRYGATASASTGFAAPAAGAGAVFPAFPGGVMDFGPLGDPGLVSVANNGTASAPVKFIVTGPGPAGGFTITDVTTGKKITYLGDLPAGSELVLDGADGTVVIDGIADRSGDTIVEAWPTIPKQSERSFLFEPLSSTSAALLTVQCVSTYW